jgi:hypothetical protein
MLMMSHWWFMLIHQKVIRITSTAQVERRVLALRVLWSHLPHIRSEEAYME